MNKLIKRNIPDTRDRERERDREKQRELLEGECQRLTKEILEKEREKKKESETKNEM